MRRAILALGLSLAVVGTSPIHADTDNRWYVSVMMDNIIPDKDRGNGRSELGGSIQIGKMMSKNLWLEGRYSVADYQDGAVETKGYGINALYWFNQPQYGAYILLGAGFQDTDAGTEKYDNETFDYGAGFLYKVGSDSLSIRGEIKARVDNHGNPGGIYSQKSFNDVFVSLGLFSAIGEPRGEFPTFPAYEGELDNRIYLTAMYSQLFADRSRASDDSANYQAGIGVPVSSKMDLEIRHSEHEDAGTTITTTGLDAIYHFYRNPEFQPFILVGYGQSENETGGMTLRGPSADAGIGFKRLLGDNWGARVDLRYRASFDDLEGLRDGIANVGLYVPFGKRPGAEEPVEEEAEEAEEEIEEEVEEEPAEEEPEEEEAVEEEPEPEEEVVEEPVEEPAEPENTDLDNDGVENDTDECPDTLEGLEVNDKGCVVKQDIVLKGVNFEFESANLTDEAKEILDEVAESLNGQTAVKAKINGHTDWRGKQTHNQPLSEARAESVKAYLVEKGVDEERLSAEGFGELVPIASNENEEGRAQNRRVEMQLDED